MLKTTQRQLDLAQRLADNINAYDKDANAEVKNTNGFITVSGHSRWKSWLISVGVRGGLTDLYTKKSIKFCYAEVSYKIW